MPERKMWDTFFDPTNLLTKLGFDGKFDDVAEFGCGYGTFTIPASKLIQGQIFALDIDPEMIRITKEVAQEHNRTNIQVNLRDFMVDGSGLPDKIDEAKRILKDGGKSGVIHWNYDASTPRGPSMEIRPKSEDCVKWIENAGFQLKKAHDLKPYHYGLAFIKQ